MQDVRAPRPEKHTGGPRPSFDVAFDFELDPAVMVTPHCVGEDVDAETLYLPLSLRGP
jgi:hypothetical protein